MAPGISLRCTCVSTPISRIRCARSDPFAATPQEDSAALRRCVLELIDNESQDIVILAHSYGGVVTGGAVTGLSTTARSSEGKKGGVLGLIYMAAIICPERKSMIDIQGRPYPDWAVPDQVDAPRRCYA